MKNHTLLIILTIVVLFSNPKINYGQAPDLGTASEFALFTAIGAFGNVGETDVTGDIGTNVGIFTGFPPGIVHGEIHIGNSVSAQAATDVNTAYTYLVELPCDSILASTLGNDQVFSPNVYCHGTAATLNGDLYLNGQGDPDAVFVIKINGAFTVNPSSSVILINSASLNNVFWQINGEFILGNGAFFFGTVIVNGAINLLESSTLQGRGLSRDGAINLYNNIVDTALFPLVGLPIELLDFNAYQTLVNVQLNWSTVSEVNNDYFTVQRSMDGISFEEVLKIYSEGNSNSEQSYSATDLHPYYGISYYRLKQTDFDWSYAYSNIIAVDFEKPFDFTIYPNPFSSSTTIRIIDASQINNAELKIYNVVGKEVLSTIIKKEATILDTNHLLPGVYFYKMINNGKIIPSGKLVCQ